MKRLAWCISLVLCLGALIVIGCSDESDRTITSTGGSFSDASMNGIETDDWSGDTGDNTESDWAVSDESEEEVETELPLEDNEDENDNLDDDPNFKYPNEAEKNL